MRLSYAVIFLALTSILLGCSSKPRVVRTDPFLMSADDFRKNVKILAVAPLAVPEGLADPALLVAEFSSRIDEELNRYGYSVIRPQQYAAIWNRLSQESDDFRNPVTQERNDVKMSQAMFQTLDELDAGFELDGVLFPSIIVVKAEFGAGTAVWDGVEQQIETGGPMTSFFSGSQRGEIGALSLQACIRDKDGNTVFLNSGGIEVLSKMAGKEFVAVPRQNLFADKERNRRAVAIALNPLKR